MWNDILGKWIEFQKSQNERDAEYLLGPMIFIEDNESAILKVVDGQQRISTLTMIIAIARDICNEMYLDTNNDQYEAEDDILNLVEKMPDLTPIDYSFKNWRLKMNFIDEELFTEMVQKYRSESFDHFRKPGEKYRRISKKIRYYQKEIKSKNNMFKDSEKKLISAYIYLYEQLNDALVTNFFMADDPHEMLQKFRTQSEEESDLELRNNSPGGLPVDFFDGSLEGLDTYENRSWDTDGWKYIKQKYDDYLTKTRRKTKNTFDEWLEEEIEKLKEQKHSGGKNYNSIKKDLIDQRIEKLSKQNKIDNIPNLKNFVKGLIGHSLSNIRIIVNEDDDAFQIFETINGRGEALSKSNLIKNLLLGKIKDNADKNKFSEKWDELINSVKDPDSLLFESIRSRGHDDGNKVSCTNFPIQHLSGKVKASKTNLFKIIKYRFKQFENNGQSSSNPKDFEEKSESLAIAYITKDLTLDAGISNILSDPDSNFKSESKSKIRENRDPLPALIDLHDLDAEYPRLPIMAAYRKWRPDTDEFIILVKILVCFFFRYKTIRDKKATKLENLMLTICEEIHNGSNPKSDLEKIIKFLIQEDDDSDFVDNINEYKVENQTNVAKFILKHISHYLGSDVSDVQAIDKLELEHILPKTPKMDSKIHEDNWDQKNFFSTYEKDYPEAQKLDRWAKRLGNLTLLHDIVNKSISNSSFNTKLNYVDQTKKPAKKIGYAYSGLEINKQTVVKDEQNQKIRTEWTVSSIYNRGNYFGTLAKNIWALPKLTCSDSECSNHTHPKKISGYKISEINDVSCPVCNKQTLNLSWPSKLGKEYEKPKDFSF